MHGMSLARRERMEVIATVVVVVVVGMAVAAEPLFLGKAWYYRDLVLFFLPIRELQVLLIEQGHGLWWDPWRNGGQPLLASPNTSSLHPTLLLYLLIPARVALGLAVAGCTAASMYCVARLGARTGLDVTGSLFAAIVFGTSGVLAATVNLPLFLGLCAVPPLTLFLDSWIRHRSMRAFALAIACGGWIVVSGTLEVGLVAAVTGTTWALCVPSSASLLRRGAALILLGTGSVALGAVQVLPAWHLYQASRRAAGLAVELTLGWSVHPHRIAELILPGMLGRMDALDRSAEWTAGLEGSAGAYLVSIHVGAIPVILALVALLASDSDSLTRRLKWGLASLIVISLVVSLGRYLPGSSNLIAGVALPVRFPVKALLALPLPLAILAAHGLAELRRAPSAGRRTAAISGVLAVAMVSAGTACMAGTTTARACVAWLVRMDAPGAPAGIAISLYVAAGQCAAIALTWLLRHHKAGAALVHVTVALTGVILFWRVNPAVDPAILAGEPPSAGIVLESLAGGRHYSDPGAEAFHLRAPMDDDVFRERWRLARLSEVHAARFGIPTIFHDDYDGLISNGLGRLTDAVQSSTWPERLRLLSASAVRIVTTTTELSGDGLRLLARVPLEASEPLRIYELTATAPAIRFVPASVVARDADEALSLLVAPESDPLRRVVLTDGPVNVPPENCEGRVVPDHLGDVADWSGIVESTCDGFVVMAIPPHAGTVVTVDGVVSDLLAADVAYFAVAVRAGRHAITWRYRPPGFWAGALISAAMLAILAGLISRRSSPRPEDSGAA